MLYADAGDSPLTPGSRDYAISINARTFGISDIASDEPTVLGSTTTAGVDPIDPITWIVGALLL